MHGLSKETYNKIKDVLNEYSQCKVVLFGSRAKGNYKYNSDIDLAIINDVSSDIIDGLRNALSELNIIYKIDFVVVKECSNEKLVTNIMNEGVEF